MIYGEKTIIDVVVSCIKKGKKESKPLSGTIVHMSAVKNISLEILKYQL